MRLALYGAMREREARREGFREPGSHLAARRIKGWMEATRCDAEFRISSRLLAKKRGARTIKRRFS